MKSACGLFVVALLAGLSSSPAAAELKDLGEFPARETAKEFKIAKYHYWKQGLEILAEGSDEKGGLIVNLRVGWPGDMTARIHVTTPEEDRDVLVTAHVDSTWIELQDNRSGMKARIALDVATRQWSLTGPNETLEAFRARESRILGIAIGGYVDILENLNLGPEAPRPLPQEEGPKTESNRGGPELCEWFLCNGQQVVANDGGFTPTRCCNGARAKANADCFLFGGGDCAGCCTYSTCSYLCFLPGPTACSCTIVGTSCGASSLEPCEEWPPECT